MSVLARPDRHEPTCSTPIQMALPAYLPTRQAIRRETARPSGPAGGAGAPSSARRRARPSASRLDLAPQPAPACHVPACCRNGGRRCERIETLMTVGHGGWDADVAGMTPGDVVRVPCCSGGVAPELEQVVGAAEQVPFRSTRLEAAALEAARTADVFDVAKDRLDALFPELVAGLAVRASELGLHRGPQPGAPGS